MFGALSNLTPTSTMQHPPKTATVCAVIALLLLAGQGLAIRHLVATPYSWDGPLPGLSTLHMPGDVDEAAPWMMLLKALPRRAPDPALLALERQAAATADSVGTAYATLWNALSSAQQAQIRRPSTALVDPLFPGINGDTLSLLDYAIAALMPVQDRTGTVPAPSASGAWQTLDLPMPQTIFWGITRLARTPAPPLHRTQRQLLNLCLQQCAAQVIAYQTVRIDVWKYLKMPRIDLRAQKFPFPAPQELRAVRRLGTP